MTHPTSRPVAISLRLYRALARAFPYDEFKNAYGDELVQVTEDAIESIWRRQGVLGSVRLLADIAIRVPVEYMAEFWQDIRYGLRMLAGLHRRRADLAHLRHRRRNVSLQRAERDGSARRSGRFEARRVGYARGAGIVS